MRTFNVIVIFFVLNVAATFGGVTCKKVYPPITDTCDLKACKENCEAAGATGFCQVERDMTRRCMCMSNPLPPPLCDPSACSNDCINNGNGATGGICQVERDMSVRCMCSYNPLPPPLCDPSACSNDCINNGNGATGGICQVERDGSLKCMCMY